MAQPTGTGRSPSPARGLLAAVAAVATAAAVWQLVGAALTGWSL